MKKLLSILFLSLGLVAASAQASPTAPVSGKDYTVLSTAAAHRRAGRQDRSHRILLVRLPALQ